MENFHINPIEVQNLNCETAFALGKCQVGRGGGEVKNYMV